MATQNILKIDSGTIEIGELPFDLLTVDKSEMLSVFCPANSEINSLQREDLIRKKQKFFIKISEFEQYLEYIFDRVERVVASQWVDTQVKANLLYEIGKRLVQKIHQDPLNKAHTEQFGRFVKSLIDMMLHSNEAVAHLIYLSSATPYKLSHSFNTSTFCMLLGQKIFGNNRKKLWLLGMGGVLLDIGMTRIDPAIINKKGKLTAPELEIVKQHTIISQRIIERLKLHPEIYAMAKYHHERFDGSGYPQGTKGEEIPVYARIAAVADVYDALTSDRAYKKQANNLTALREMYELREGFEPAILDALTEIVLKSQKLIKLFHSQIKKDDDTRFPVIEME